MEEAGLPRCDCGRPLKPDVVLFGEMLDEAAMSRASALAAGADLMLCIGSSLEVWPVAELPEITLNSGGAVAIVTRSATPYDGRAAVRLAATSWRSSRRCLKGWACRERGRPAARRRRFPRCATRGRHDRLNGRVGLLTRA